MPDASPSELEAERILAEHRRREREIRADFYSPAEPANLFVRQGQQRALRDALARAGMFPLADRRILEIGCGRGNWIGAFEDFGARRAHVAGVDLDAGRIADARARYPSADLRVGDASRLEWPAGAFDVVFQAVVFTSILDASVRAGVAAEMRRVLARGGAILWYDFMYDNPANPHVRGIGRAELARLFPGAAIDARRVTLAPPLARRLVPISWFAASLVERLRLLDTHYFAIIRPR